MCESIFLYEKIQLSVLLPFSFTEKYLQLPCPISDTETILMITRAVQCHLREYICTDAESSVPWASSGDDDTDALSRAWFSEDVEFEETTVRISFL